MTTIEGNKLIAEFMGWKYLPETANHGIQDNSWKDKRNQNHYELLFHSSWDWLMPVVDKIEMSTIYSLTIDYDKRDEFKGWSVHWFTLCAKNEILGFIEDNRFVNKIDAAWFAVVEFIQWYNQNK